MKNKINYVIHTKLHTKNKHPIGPNNVYFLIFLLGKPRQER